MNSKKNGTIYTIIKKTAVMTAVLLLIINPLFVGKSKPAFFINGTDFSDKSELRQSAANVSMYINKTAGVISRLFMSRSPSISSMLFNDNIPEETNEQNKLPLKNVNSVLPEEKTSDILFNYGNCDILQINGTKFCEVYADFSGAGMPPGYKFLISYFITMLIFFASTIKIFNVIFHFRNISMPAYA